MSPRSLALHLAFVVWFSGCVLATYWQVGRAIQGNLYSYAYAVEWPAFAIAGVFGWWAFLHADHATSVDKQRRREVAHRERAQVQAVKRDREHEDPELAAYNDHLARLAERSEHKAWRR